MSSKHRIYRYNFDPQEMDVTAVTNVEVPQGPNATVDLTTDCHHGQRRPRKWRYPGTATSTSHYSTTRFSTWT
jgi:hypothetical protein